MPKMKHLRRVRGSILSSCPLLFFIAHTAFAGAGIWTPFPNDSVFQNVTVSALAQHPVDPKVFYAAVAGAMYRSSDGGLTWSVGTGAPTVGYKDRIYLDPKNVSVAYLIDHFSLSNIFKTSDGGATWKALSVSALDMAIDPRDTNTIYLCFDNSFGSDVSSGILKSNDGGATWRQTFGSGSYYDPRFVALAQDPQQPDVLYAWADADGYDPGIYKSIDAGETWSRFSVGPIRSINEGSGIIVDPRDSKTLYAYDSNNGIFKSTDGGTAWSQALSAYLELYNTSGLTLNAANSRSLASFKADLFTISNDAGGHWSPLGDGLQGYISCVLFDLRDPRTVIIGSSHGLQALTLPDKIPTRLKLLSPKGGDSWEAGRFSSITWQATADIWDFRIELSIDNGTTYKALATSVINSFGGYSIEVPNTPTSSARIRITDPVSGASDVIAAPFSIVEGASRYAVTIDSPTDGALVSGPVTFRVSLSRPVSVNQVNFLLNDTVIGSSYQPPYEFTLNTAPYLNGTRRLQVSVLPQNPAERIETAGINVTFNNPEPDNPPYPAILMLPSSARAPGLGGSFYTTDLTISNPGGVDTHFTMKFLGHDMDGTNGPEKNLLITGGTTMTFFDVLKSAFGLETAYGAIMIKSYNEDLRASAQTSTPGIGGTFGQSVPGTHKNIVKSEFGSLDGIINGIREDGSFRTNLILVNQYSIETDVEVSLYNADGELLAHKTVQLPPLGMTQITRVVRDLGIGNDIVGGSLRLTITSQYGSLNAYASVIDNVTNDPRTLLAVNFGSIGEIPSGTYIGYQILPSSARVGGLGGSFYTTDVSIMNTSMMNIHGILRSLGHDRDGRESPPYRFALDAGRTLFIPDVLHTVFGLESGYGAIELSADNYNLEISGQTSTPGAGGTFGQSVPGSGDRSSFIYPLASRSIAPIRDDSAFRTNLILANAVQIPALVKVSLFGSDGTLLGSRDVTLPPLGMTQISRVVRELGVSGDIRDARITLSTSTPSALVAGYAAEIDNVTNDPRTLLPR